MAGSTDALRELAEALRFQLHAERERRQQDTAALRREFAERLERQAEAFERAMLAARAEWLESLLDHERSLRTEVERLRGAAPAALRVVGG